MILVTGGAGFIGSNIVAALEKAGKQFVICDWLETGDKWRNIGKRLPHALVRPEDLPAYLAQNSRAITAVVHMGAISTTTERDNDKIVKNNFQLSCDLWNWCAAEGKPFIYASSAATYGDGQQGFVDNNTVDALAQLRPMNAYGWSKHVFDRWVLAQKAMGRPTPPQHVGLKFFNVYGPNEYHKGGQRSVAHQVFPYAIERKPFMLFKSHNPQYVDGGQLRDFVWVGDCVNVVLYFLANPGKSGLFNVGSGKARSFLDLANAVYRAAGTEPLISFRDMPQELQGTYQYFTEGDMRNLLAAGYSQPLTTLEDGITSYVQNYLMKPDSYI